MRRSRSADSVPHRRLAAYSVQLTRQSRHPEQPVEAGHAAHSYWLAADREPELIALLTDTPALALAEVLTSPRRIVPTRYPQVALTFTPYRHGPARGHLDGLPPTEPDGRPGTLTMLAGVILSDQTKPMMGNLIVWPGTHRFGGGPWRVDPAGHESSRFIDDAQAVFQEGAVQGPVEPNQQRLQGSRLAAGDTATWPDRPASELVGRPCSVARRPLAADGHGRLGTCARLSLISASPRPADTRPHGWVRVRA